MQKASTQYAKNKSANRIYITRLKYNLNVADILEIVRSAIIS